MSYKTVNSVLSSIWSLQWYQFLHCYLLNSYIVFQIQRIISHTPQQERAELDPNVYAYNQFSSETNQMIQCLTYPRTKWVLAVADISVISRSLHDSSGCQVKAEHLVWQSHFRERRGRKCQTKPDQQSQKRSTHFFVKSGFVG